QRRGGGGATALLVQQGNVEQGSRLVDASGFAGAVQRQGAVERLQRRLILAQLPLRLAEAEQMGCLLGVGLAEVGGQRRCLAIAALGGTERLAGDVQFAKLDQHATQIVLTPRALEDRLRRGVQYKGLVEPPLAASQGAQVHLRPAKAPIAIATRLSIEIGGA